MARQKTKQVGRSAITGRFVTKKHVNRNPKTTVKDTVPVRKKK